MRHKLNNLVKHPRTIKVTPKKPVHNDRSWKSLLKVLKNFPEWNFVKDEADYKEKDFFKN